MGRYTHNNGFVIHDNHIINKKHLHYGNITEVTTLIPIFDLVFMLFSSFMLLKKNVLYLYNFFYNMSIKKTRIKHLNKKNHMTAQYKSTPL